MSAFDLAFANADAARSILNDTSELEIKLFVTGVVTNGDVSCVRDELDRRLQRIKRNASAIAERSRAAMEAAKAADRAKGGAA